MSLGCVGLTVKANHCIIKVSNAEAFLSHDHCTHSLSASIATKNDSFKVLQFLLDTASIIVVVLGQGSQYIFLDRHMDRGITEWVGRDNSDVCTLGGLV